MTMSRRDRLRHRLATVLRPQTARPQEAADVVNTSAAIASAASVTTPPPPTAPPSSSSASAAPPSSSPTQPLFPVMRLVENPSSSNSSPPCSVFVSLSSDLRLIHVKPAASAPTSLLDFCSPDLKLALDRLADAPTHGASSTQSLESAVEPRVCAAPHSDGPAVRITDGSKPAILLVSDTEDERDALLLALCLRVAPWRILRAHMEGEVVAARHSIATARHPIAAARHPIASSSSPPSLADAAREFFGPAPRESPAETKARMAVLAKRVWENACTVAETSIWTASFAQGSAGVAKKVERPSKPLGGLVVVGCAFSLVATSARAVNLISLQKMRIVELVRAADDLREASLLLVRWLLNDLGSGFMDELKLFDALIGVLEECLLTAERLEAHLVGRRLARAWSAEDVRIIVARVNVLREKLFAVGLGKVLTTLDNEVQDLENRIIDLNAPASDQFCQPTLSGHELGVELVAGAAICLDKLKMAILSPGSKADVNYCRLVDDFSSELGSLRLPRVPLISISGEGGVGKTSTCRLLCQDDDVRMHFNGGAVVWIDVGISATDEKVTDEVRRAVTQFGGDRSAKLVQSAGSVIEIVNIASEFFSERRILVIIDNVWETPVGSSVMSWTSVLAQIASHSGSAVIATTRSSSLARSPGFEQLQLGHLDLTSDSSLDWRVAEDLYDVLLQGTVDAQSEALYEKIRTRALALSVGVLLAITTFASLVQRCYETGDDAEALLEKIEAMAVRLGGRDVGEDAEATVGHPGLFVAMKESLNFLDERRGRSVKSELFLPQDRDDKKGCRVFSAGYTNFFDQVFTARYAALHMIDETSLSISLPLLCHLWHVATIDEANYIALQFIDIGLARKEGNKLALHKLQFEFCHQLRSSTGGAFSINGHALFLTSCESLLQTSYGRFDDALWASFCFEELDEHDAALRGYLPNNLLRHFCSAAPSPENSDFEENLSACTASNRVIVSVLSDFCWLRGRCNSIGGRQSLLQDFSYVLESGLLPDSDADFLRLIQETLMLASDDVLSQSYGNFRTSLIQLAELVASGENSFTTGAVGLTEVAEDHLFDAWKKPPSTPCWHSSDSDEFFDCKASTDTDSSFDFDRSDWPEVSLPGHSTSGELLHQDLIVRQTLGLCLSADCPPGLKHELSLEGDSLRSDISSMIGAEDWSEVLALCVRVRKWVAKAVGTDSEGETSFDMRTGSGSARGEDTFSIEGKPG